MARMTDQLTLEQHLLGYALNPIKKAEIEVFVKKNVPVAGGRLALPTKDVNASTNTDHAVKQEA